MQIIKGLREIHSDFKVAMIDQWGVMHNGVSAYPYAVDCMTKLRDQGIFVICLSNSSRPTGYLTDFLSSINFDKGRQYDALLTSGDMVLRNVLANFKHGKNFYVVSWQENMPDEEPLTQEVILAGGKLCTDIDRADWVLLVGFDPMLSLDYYIKKLAKKALSGIPIVCSNPDIVTVTPNGDIVKCPGMIAKALEELGAEVKLYGKPYPETYLAASDLAPAHKRQEIIGIGDSLSHDIKGAHNHKGKSLLITEGIHKKDIGYYAKDEKIGNETKKRIAKICTDKQDPLPDFIMPELKW